MLADHIDNISDEDIGYAESILLKSGCTFDDERREFIKDLTTLDLQAVPGSGKTTTLLAKLLIIERYLPFKDGSGVLVISHTNTAVNEIKNRIGMYCPKLFSYPNFIGTIQSFVDQFLAIPFYENSFKQRLLYIDNDLYNGYIEKYNLPYKANAWVNRKQEALQFKQSIRFDCDLNLISSIDKTSTDFELKDQNTDTYKALKAMKISALKKGILSFDDIYFLAEVYLKNRPQITQLLQKRFRAVFVDEMQDMAKHQYELIEKVFFTPETMTVLQRIGDKNQAIYSGLVGTDEIWVDRDNIRYLSGTHRLSQPIAEVVKFFGITSLEIEAKNNYAGDIKPHLFIYNAGSILNVIPQFSQRIRELQIEGKIPSDSCHPIKAIAWVSQEDKPTSIKSYFPDFERNEYKAKQHFDNLIGYLVHYDKKQNSFESIRKNIIKAFLIVLRLEEITDIQGRHFTEIKLLKYLREETDKYDEFNLKLFNWCKKIVLENRLEDAYEELKEYVGSFLGLFDSSVRKSTNFISDMTLSAPLPAGDSRQKNHYHTDGIDVKIGTVHSVKGETHLATLYLETFYQRSCIGGNYESQRLSPHFNGIDVGTRKASETITDFAETILLQSMKMAYVGFSRPTHLLCFAVHEDRVGNLADMVNWEIIRVSEVIE